jgi:ferredoxin
MFGFPTRRIRIVVQTAVFFLWVSLILVTHYPMDSWLASHVPVSLLLRIDPLVTTVVCGGLRIAVSITFLGFVTLGISLLLGRVFCGWVCPLGAIFDAYGWILRRLRVKFEGPSPSYFRFKYYLLLAILIFAAVGGVSPLMGFDPIVLLTRVAAAVLMPFGRHPAQLTWEAGAAPGRYGYFFDFLTLFLFIGIMTATTKLSRVWCRVACPLGAYLGALSRNAVLRRDTTGCVHCNICSQHCPTGAISFDNAEVYNESECIKCFACSQECPVDANFFTWKNPLAALTTTHAPVELERRQFLTTAVFAAIAAPALHLSGGAPASHKKLLRPPMAREEHDFLTSCIRCEECIKACPTGVLKPAPFEHGFRALWSPVMIPSEGFCQEGCNACSTACPTDAIMKYPIEQKYAFKAGTAVFNASHCITTTENKFCLECVKVCPTDAIVVNKGWEPPGGGSSDQPAPKGSTPSMPMMVSYDRCVGCGHCEFVCNQIVPGEVAMLTTSFGRAMPTQLDKI